MLEKKKGTRKNTTLCYVHPYIFLIPIFDISFMCTVNILYNVVYHVQYTRTEYIGRVLLVYFFLYFLFFFFHQGQTTLYIHAGTIS